MATDLQKATESHHSVHMVGIGSDWSKMYWYGRSRASSPETRFLSGEQKRRKVILQTCLHFANMELYSVSRIALMK